jgi:hypothetical protein
MFNNDINYVFKEIPYPVEGTKEDLKSVILGLLNQHHEDSRSSAFINAAEGLDGFKASLPKGWDIAFDESTKIPARTIRIVVYNKYDEADRIFGSDFKSVNLRASNLFGDIWTVSVAKCEQGDSSNLPLTLLGAKGTSVTRVAVFGGHSGELHKNYDDLGISFDFDNYEVSIPEKNLDRLMDEIIAD